MLAVITPLELEQVATAAHSCTDGEAPGLSAGYTYVTSLVIVAVATPYLRASQCCRMLSSMTLHPVTMAPAVAVVFWLGVCVRVWVCVRVCVRVCVGVCVCMCV
eukprot:scpid92168/ scgid24101/ 